MQSYIGVSKMCLLTSLQFLDVKDNFETRCYRVFVPNLLCDLGIS